MLRYRSPADHRRDTSRRATTTTPDLLMDVVCRFTGPHGFLSNHHVAPVLLLSSWAPAGYPSGEHAFQAGKATTREHHDWILTAPSPGAAKSRGRAVTLHPHWVLYRRYTVMEAVVRAKFSFELRALLDATGEALLVEGNDWHDDVWGDCRCGRPACALSGMNLLGWMLMRQRGVNRGT